MSVGSCGARPSGGVLVLGWRQASIEALYRQGCDVTCVVPQKDAEKARSSDLVARCVVVPEADDVEHCLAGLARLELDLGGFSAVCSGSEYGLVPAAVLGRLASVPAMPVRTAIALRDKFEQKRLVRAAGLATAACRVVDDLTGLGPELPPAGVVVKPLSGAGAKNTVHVTRDTDLRGLVAEVGAAPGPWLVESYVAGEELQLDGVVRDGVVTGLAVSQYLQNLIEIRSGGLVSGITLHPVEHPEVYDRGHEFVSGALAALGHRDGVFHLEAFAQPDRLVFGECAGRVSGGMTDEVVLRMFGLDMHDEWARAVLGRPPHPSRPAPTAETYADLYLPASTGRVLSMPDAEAVMAQPGVVAVRMKVVSGQVMPNMTTATDIRAGNAVVKAADSARARERILRLAAWFRASCEVA